MLFDNLTKNHSEASKTKNVRMTPTCETILCQEALILTYDCYHVWLLLVLILTQCFDQILSGHFQVSLSDG